MRVFLVLVSLLAIFVFGMVGSLVANYNSYVSYEELIKAQDVAIGNTLSNTVLTVKDLMKLKDSQVGDLRNVIKDQMSGRYGEDGSKAMMQWIGEQGIQLPQTIYNDISVAIRAGRANTKLDQDRKIDTCKDYAKALREFPGGFIKRFLGAEYPEQTCKIIMESSATEQMGTKVATQIL